MNNQKAIEKSIRAISAKEVLRQAKETEDTRVWRCMADDYRKMITALAFTEEQKREIESSGIMVIEFKRCMINLKRLQSVDRFGQEYHGIEVGNVFGFPLVDNLLGGCNATTRLL